MFCYVNSVLFRLLCFAKLWRKNEKNNTNQKFFWIFVQIWSGRAVASGRTHAGGRKVERPRARHIAPRGEFLLLLLLSLRGKFSIFPIRSRGEFLILGIKKAGEFRNCPAQKGIFINGFPADFTEVRLL